MKHLKACGQATVEYIFILAFAIFIARFALLEFRGFFIDSMGSVGHVLSTNLIVGVCEKECFFQSYINGHK